MDIPLIYTARGNVPTDSLLFQTVWEDTPDYTKLTETYTAKDSGEVVRTDVHVLGKLPAPSVCAAQASL